jgi:homoaconitase/3-isopropylmalate dehydratase large subunit
MGWVNIIEKGLAKKAQLDLVIPGERIRLVPDVLLLSGDSILRIIEEFYELEYDKVLHSSSTFIFQNTSLNSAEVVCFSEKYGVELVEHESALPIQVETMKEKVFTGVEGEIGAFGAYGAISLKVSPAAMAKCLGVGTIEFTIPETVYIELNGRFNGNQKVERLCEYMMDYFNDSLVGYGIILGGEALKQLDLEEKSRLTTFLYELGGAIGIISPSGPLGQVESVMKIKTFQIPDKNSV